MKSILEFNHAEARKFFLKEESYFNAALPEYFRFSELLNSDEISNLKTYPKRPADFENVNHKIWCNKDGEYSWRLLQLIHPVLYVSLVNKITEKEKWNYIVDRFKRIFQSNQNIECASLPVQKSEKQKSDKAEQILSWWDKVEQRSIELSLEYDYIFRTDIVGCYGSLYTHSIAWALYGKEEAKKKENRYNTALIGVQIDKLLSSMANGQTNGIPEGSVLMDFIAEMVLGYIDIELSNKIANVNENYKIIRYRDDYRIFVNNPEIGKRIIKELSNVLSEIGMKIKPEKTGYSNDVIIDSVKPDKLFWLTNGKINNNPRKQLLILLELSRRYSNSGTLNRELDIFYNAKFKKFCEEIKNQKNKNENINTLIGIVVDIAFKNPRTYPIASAILSNFLFLQEADQAMHNVEKIVAKFKRLPNTEHLDLWLQRITLKIDENFEYESQLCKRVRNDSISVWNSEWLNKDTRNIISSANIIDREFIAKMRPIISKKEVSPFARRDYR